MITNSVFKGSMSRFPGHEQIERRLSCRDPQILAASLKWKNYKTKQFTRTNAKHELVFHCVSWFSAPKNQHHICLLSFCWKSWLKHIETFRQNGHQKSLWDCRLSQHSTDDQTSGSPSAALRSHVALVFPLFLGFWMKFTSGNVSDIENAFFSAQDCHFDCYLGVVEWTAQALLSMTASRTVLRPQKGSFRGERVGHTHTHTLWEHTHWR